MLGLDARQPRIEWRLIEVRTFGELGERPGESRIFSPDENLTRRTQATGYGFDEPRLLVRAALQTHFDFDAGESEPATIHRLLQGKSITIPAGTGDGLDEVLQCARFRYDEAWLEYYRATARLPEVGDALLRASLSTVAFDLPLLLALFLLFATRTRLPQTQPDLARVNAKRHRSATQPLLDYIEA